MSNNGTLKIKLSGGELFHTDLGNLGLEYEEKDRGIDMCLALEKKYKDRENEAD